MEMMSTPQVMEMMRELQQQELDRVSVHRIEAMVQREGVRRTVASALVRLGMMVDRSAGADALPARAERPYRADTGAEMHW
jgi:hypothetical protein